MANSSNQDNTGKTSKGNKAALERRTQRNIEKRKKSADTAIRLADKKLAAKEKNINNFRTNSIQGLNRNDQNSVGPSQPIPTKSPAPRLGGSKFSLSPITSINGPATGVRAPSLPQSRISGGTPQSLAGTANSMLSDMYNKLLGTFDTTKDSLVGGAIGFKNEGVVPGFKQNTTSGITNFDEAKNPVRGDIDRLKEAYRNEAAKSVRVRGDNVDPFDTSSSARNLGRLRNLQNRIQGGGQNDLIKEANSIRSQLDSTVSLKPKTSSGLISPSSINKNPIDYNSVASIRSALYKRQVSVDRRLERNARIMSTVNTGSFEYAKGFLPKEGVSGYGLGFNNYLAASRKELFARGVGFTGGIVGNSGLEALKNSFGIVTAKQRAYTQSRGLLGKLMTAGVQSPLMTYASLMYTASSGGDLTDFVETQATVAAGLQGWRIGTSFGGMMTKGTGANLSQVGVKNSLSALKAQGGAATLRGAAGLVGGLTGFALGAVAVSGASWLAKDISSNTSSIRKIAKDFTTKTAKMNTQDTRQSLTMRQMAINKLAKSGLNDRATLLGNESRVLKGIM